ncbi:MAG: DUF4250 domain-containing protein [Candidatus Limivivens sp.]|nr:DUF4250 domain-containing protein [Candidatus Limivivens sp.]
MIPKDPFILLSYVNTQLRDHYSSLEKMCIGLGIDQHELVEKLAMVDYTYEEKTNQFV